MIYTIYELKLKPLSWWITDLTADTIFWHLCWQIKYEFWDEVLKEFLKEMEKEPIFVLSDVLPADRLIKPFTEFDGDIKNDLSTLWDKKLFLKYWKKYKKEIKYISEDDLNKFSDYTKEKILNYINNKDFINENNTYWKYFGEDLENKNVIDRNSFTTWDNGIYSQNFFFFKENEKNKVVKILLKKIKKDVNLENYEILWKKVNFLELIKNIFKIWFWKKKSSWKWQFQVWDWKEKNDLVKENGKNILLLSSFIPLENNSIKGNYKLITKFPKMWEDFSTEWQNFYKKPIVMIQSWSVFENNWNWYVWKMIKNVDFQDKWIYHYAYWFTLEF